MASSRLVGRLGAFGLFVAAVSCGDDTSSSPPPSNRCVAVVPAPQRPLAIVRVQTADGMILGEYPLFGLVGCDFTDASRTRLRCGSTPTERPNGGIVHGGFLLEFREPLQYDALVNTPRRLGQDFEVREMHLWYQNGRYDAPLPITGNVTVTVVRASAGRDAQGTPLAVPLSYIVGTLCSGQLAASFDTNLAHPDEPRM